MDDCRKITAAEPPYKGGVFCGTSLFFGVVISNHECRKIELCGAYYEYPKKTN